MAKRPVRVSPERKSNFLPLMSSRMNFSRGYGSWWCCVHTLPRVGSLARAHTRTHAYTEGCIAAQDLPRHRHSDPRLSVSFQSQTRWMAGEWKSWLKPNPHTPASFHWRGRGGERQGAPREKGGEKGDTPPFCLRPPLCRETRHPRVIPRFDLVSSPFASFVL